MTPHVFSWRRSCSVPERDRGSVLVLGIGLAVLVLLLASVVVDASRAFLARRALAALADGTALQAAHSVDLATLYASEPAASLPLADAAARREAATYVASHSLGAGVPSARLVAVTVDGPTVRVTLTMTEPATLAASVLGGASVQHLTVTASASSEVVP